jgi:hypothetical protein
VNGVDRRLYLVRAGLTAAQAAADQLLALGDQLAVPAAAVLVGEQHHLAVWSRARRPARLDEQHQREQPGDLLLVGHQLGQQPAEPDRLRAQVLAHEPVARARRVPLVEDQVDDRQHGPQALGQVGLARDAVRDPSVADLALRTHKPLCHRRRHAERARDLRRRQAAEQPQRQRDARGRAERRVAAGEDQPQPLVAHRPLLDRLVAGVQERGLGVPVVARGLAAEPAIAALRGRDDPAGRARRHAGLRPALQRPRERVLNRLLGDVDVTEHAHEHGDRATVLLAEDTLDLLLHQSWNGRTSTGSVVASASRRPHSSAASRSGARTIVKPPMCSFPSANGPSVVSTSPSRGRRTVAVLGGCRPPANTHAPAALSSWLSASRSLMILSRTSGGGGPPAGW